MPAGACDAHLHIVDARHAYGGPPVPAATVDDYRRVQRRLGTQRAVIVTPRGAGTDNAVTLDAIQRLGPAHTRGVAVVHPGVSDATLAQLHAGGIRGIRFTLYTPAQAVTTFDMVEPLACRVHELGWHVQLHWTADQIVAHAALLARLPATLVFDHLGRLPLPQGTGHAAFALMARRVDSGRAWVKLSGAYLDSRCASTATPLQDRWADLDPVAQAWVRLAPERLVWGSDWPHMTELHRPDGPPDTVGLLGLLDRWAGDDRVRQRILVDNPARLYDFASPP